MIQPSIEPEKPRDKYDDAFQSDEGWAEMKAKEAKFKIRWDEKRQEYVAGP